jgi:hypothetical protein
MTKSKLIMWISPSNFLNVLFIIAVFTFVGCKKNNVSDNAANPPPPPNVNNNPPGQFTISLVTCSWDTATITWTKAIDPDNDSVSYKIYLNDTLKVENYKALSYTFKNLNEVTSYDVKILAVDSKLKETRSVLNFTTKKYWLKYLKKVDYGIFSPYTSKTTGQMVEANDGGYIMASFVELADWPNPPFKLCTIKIDSLGNKIWEKYYDYSRSFELRIVSNNHNGYIISSGENIIRINNNGDLIWRQAIAEHGEVIYGIAVHTDGSIYATGLIPSDSANGNVVEALLGKFDQDGNLLWKKTFSPTTRDEFHDIKIYNDELVVLAFTDDNNPHFRVLKLTLDGSIIWDKEYSSPWGYVFPQCIMKTREGNYVFTGFFYGPSYEPYFYLQMIDANGNNIWTYFADNNHTLGSCVAETNDNALIVTGGYQSTYSTHSALYKFDKNGNQLWAKLYEEFATFFLNRTVIPTSDGGYIINSQKSKAYNSPGETDQIYIFKTDDKGEFN